MTHDLKCWPEFFDAILDGRKTFEVRKNDRAFAVGDTLRLREWREEHRVIEDRFPGDYTGREVTVRVTYVLSDLVEFDDGPCLAPGYVVLGIQRPPAAPAASVEDAVRSALRATPGMIVQAVKVYRELTGANLKEAVERVRAIEARQAEAAPAPAVEGMRSMNTAELAARREYMRQRSEVVGSIAPAVDVPCLIAAYERGAASTTLQSVQAQEEAGIRAVLAALAAGDPEALRLVSQEAWDKERRRLVGASPQLEPEDIIVGAECAAAQAVALAVRAEQVQKLDAAEKRATFWEQLSDRFEALSYRVVTENERLLGLLRRARPMVRCLRPIDGDGQPDESHLLDDIDAALEVKRDG